MNIDIHRTSIYVTQYKSKKHVDIFLDLLKKCKRLNKLNTVSNIGGIQTENINCLKIQDCWKEPLNAYILQFKKVKDFKIKIYSCWINQNFTFDYNMPHNHTGSSIQFSGIWYIKAPKNCGNINFYDPNEIKKFNSPAIENLTELRVIEKNETQNNKKKFRK